MQKNLILMLIGSLTPFYFVAKESSVNEQELLKEIKQLGQPIVIPNHAIEDLFKQTCKEFEPELESVIDNLIREEFK